MVHVLFLQHGMWGNENHLNSIIEHLQSHNDQLVLANCSSNKGLATYDGIDAQAGRFIAFIHEFIKSLDKSVTHVSFLGYSLGGLVVRFAVGKLLLDGAIINISLNNHQVSLKSTPP